MGSNAVVERGTMARIPYAAVGEGRPLIVLAGLSPTTGVDGDGMVRRSLAPVRALAGSRRLILFNRRAGLPRGMTMAELAAEHAEAIRQGIGPPVDVVGVSTGGSIAQQLAAEHPDVVARLVLVSTACRLGPATRRMQNQVAARIRRGSIRGALAGMAASAVPARRGQTAAAAAAWLVGPLVLGRGHDLADMAVTIEAEDAFDLATLPTVEASTLIVGGGNDRFYDRALFEETASLITTSRLRLVDGRGHVTVMSDRRFHAELAAFLGPTTAVN